MIQLNVICTRKSALYSEEWEQGWLCDQLYSLWEEAQPEGGGGLNVCVTGVAGPDLVQSPVLGQTVCALLQEQTVCALLREKFWWT